VKIRFLVGLTLLAFCQLAPAQDTDNEDKDRQYVTDQLRLSLYQDASSQSKVLKLLRSGDKLIVDEIRGPYALVTAPDGTHGWVKRGFLVSNPTASIRLLEEQQKSANLFDELEKLGNSKVVIDAYEKDMDDLVAKIEDLEASKRDANETIASLQQEIVAAQQQEDDSQLPQSELPSADLRDTLRIYWKIIASSVLAIVLLTFLVSKLIIEARIKSRFHGIKIW
jgi:SH3 domain protein